MGDCNIFEQEMVETVLDFKKEDFYGGNTVTQVGNWPRILHVMFL